MIATYAWPGHTSMESLIFAHCVSQVYTTLSDTLCVDSYLLQSLLSPFGFPLISALEIVNVICR